MEKLVTLMSLEPALVLGVALVLLTCFFPHILACSGEWTQGVINGRGTLFIANGDRYTGEWQDGKMNGT